MSDNSNSDNTLLNQTKEFHTILHESFPDRPDICILAASHMISCPIHFNFQLFFEDKKLDGKELIEEILKSKLALLRYHFSTVLLQISAYMIKRIDEEADMGLGEEDHLNELDGDEDKQKKKPKLTKDYADEFCDLVIPIYIKSILENRYGPKELNLVLGILCNLSRLERGQTRLLQLKIDEELDDDDLDKNSESDEDISDIEESDDEIDELPEDDFENNSNTEKVVTKLAAGKFIPWVCKKILNSTEEEINQLADDQDSGDIIEMSAENLDTYSRCIQLMLNITKTEHGRNFILMKRQEPTLKSILSSLANGPLLRRRGCVQVIRNCLLVKEQHPIIAGIQFVEPFLDRLENKTERNDAIRRDIAECLYILSLGNQVVKLATHKQRIQSIIDKIMVNIAEKRLLIMAIEQIDGRTESVKEGDIISFDEKTGELKRIVL